MLFKANAMKVFEEIEMYFFDSATIIVMRSSSLFRFSSVVFGPAWPGLYCYAKSASSSSSFVSQVEGCLAAFCAQNAFPGRVSSYPLSVAMASRADCSTGHLRHILFVSRRSKASIDRQRRSISRVPLAKLSDGKRILLANFLVFWGSSANSNSSGDQIQTFSSL